MESSENNNEAQDQQPRDAGNADQSPQPSPEYETHTTALVFLVIVAAIISFIALTGGEGITPLVDDFGDDDTDAPTHINDASDPKTMTHGAVIPQEKVATTDTTSLAALPNGLFVAEAGIESNQTAAGGQQIVRFATDRSSAELYAEYETWMQDADYEITQEVEDEYGAKLAARGPGGEQLTVFIANPTADESATRVTIDYVAAQ